MAGMGGVPCSLFAGAPGFPWQAGRTMGMKPAQEGATAPHSAAALARLAASGLGKALALRLPRLPRHPAAFRVRGLALPLAPVARPAVADPAELYRGRFAFAGTAVETSGRIIFDHVIANPAWMRALHEFAWLSALVREEDNRLWRIFARTLIGDWLARADRLPPEALAPEVLARRLMHFIAAAPHLLDGASGEWERAFLRGLAGQARRLSRLPRAGLNARQRMLSTLALAHAAFGLAGLEGQREAAMNRLCAELEAQILPDGGHISRSPAVLLEVVAHLLPLRAALEQARLEVPHALAAALERALPMLRFFRHGDGGLALLGGVSDPAAGWLAAVLEADSTAGSPLSHAPHSGYLRLASGAAVLIADCGTPPRPAAAEDAALSAAAFEFSHGAARIITSCGSPHIPQADWQAAARRTAAHSTLCLDEADAGTIHDGRLARALFGGPLLHGPRHMQAQARAGKEGAFGEIVHDAHAPARGLLHERRLFLPPGGAELRGEDTLRPIREGAARDGAFALRFHLHPAVSPTLSRDGASVMLTLADRSGWRFSARGGRIRLEESVFLASGKGLRRAMQIVIQGETENGQARINWLLRQIAARPRGKARKAPQEGPALPL